MVEAAPTAQQQLLEQVRLGERPIVKIWCNSRYIGWNLLIE